MSATLLPALLAALVAGTFDLCYACGISWWLAGKSPEWVMQSVASGWLGMRAFDTGLAGAALGTISHYFILTVAALLFLAAARRVPLLRRHMVPAGIVFGLGIYAVMNFVVLPLSAYPFPMKFPLASVARNLVVHATIGLIVALMLRRAVTRG